jgi:mono/diheme cytochrome c family protein
MRLLSASSLGLFVAATAIAPVYADDAVARGATLAGKHCVLCHDVTIEGPDKLFPPSFASIAGFRSPEQIYARIVFPVMHSGMPEAAFYLLGATDIADLVAYIVSLEPP